MSEQVLKDIVGYPVSRGLGKYGEVFGMAKEGMLDWLKHKKRVLDIGSGGGLLQKEVNILRKQGFRSDVQIVPMDIIYGTKSGQDYARYATHLAFTDMNTIPTKSYISEIDNLFENSAVGGSFTKLPFGDESFDGILASYSFGIHSEGREQTLQAYSELERVLKSGGEARVSVIFDPETRLFRTTDKSNSVVYSLEDLPFTSSTVKLDKSIVKKGHSLITNDFLVINKE